MAADPHPMLPPQPQVHCGRYISAHMLQHHEVSGHPLVLSYVDLSTWCYNCEAYVHHQVGPGQPRECMHTHAFCAGIRGDQRVQEKGCRGLGWGSPLAEVEGSSLSLTYPLAPSGSPGCEERRSPEQVWGEHAPLTLNPRTCPSSPPSEDLDEGQPHSIPS